jgi:hypothetical protein
MLDHVSGDRSDALRIGDWSKCIARAMHIRQVIFAKQRDSRLRTTTGAKPSLACRLFSASARKLPIMHSQHNRTSISLVETHADRASAWFGKLEIQVVKRGAEACLIRRRPMRS